jgi:hypothetical protein
MPKATEKATGRANEPLGNRRTNPIVSLDSRLQQISFAACWSDQFDGGVVLIAAG